MTQISSDPSIGGTHSDQLPPLEDPSEQVIVPTKRRLKLRHLPRQLSVISVVAVRDSKLKYQQSVLGPLWLIFQPAALLVAFLVVFRGHGYARVAHEPYVVFALIGLSAWSFFMASMTIGSAAMISNVNLVRYTPCPRLAFPLAAIIASLPSFALVATAAIVGAAVSGHLSPRVLLLPAGLLWLLVLTAGIVGISSSLAVKYRDVIVALPFLLMLGVFLAPVGYSLTSVSPVVQDLIAVNPLAGLMEALRWTVLSGYAPRIAPIAISAALTAVLAVAGWRVFSLIETTMADEI